jgi:diaminopimelate epimerase
MKFTKLQALGNDFVLTEDVRVREHIIRIADRKFGIGCDQVILLQEKQVYFWNQDGSSASFCGNGCRAIFRYLGQNSIIHTAAGEVRGKLIGDLVQITYPYGQILSKADKYTVDVGNLHEITFGNDAKFNWENPDPNINHMYLFWNDGWNMLIYEKGAGETEACGSGAMAASLAIWDKYGYDGPLTVKMRGGVLEMDKSQQNLQTGPAESVFEGIWKI